MKKKRIKIILFKNVLNHLEVSEPKWVNFILNTIGVNSLGLEGIYLSICQDLFISHALNRNIYFKEIKSSKMIR